MLDILYNFSPGRLLLDLGVIKIYWYGLFMTLATLICFILFWKLAKKYYLKNRIFDLVFYILIFAFIGARLWHVLFYNLEYFSSYPLEILMIWHGGLALHGGLLGGALTLYFYSKKHQLDFLRLLDYFAAVLPLGQFIARLGNYFNQELFGPPCDYKWCIFIEQNNRPLEFISFSNFQPVFLYEMILSFLLFIFIYPKVKKEKWPTGVAVLVYIIGYSLIRFLTEFLRLDISTAFLGLNWLQWLSLVAIAGSVYLLFFRLLPKSKT